MNAPPLVALAAGGTGGHLFPAEAVAAELKRRAMRVLLVTDQRGARYAEKFPCDERIEISAASLSLGGPAAKAGAVVSLARGFFKAAQEFRRRGVAAAVGFGGYPSLPSMKAAEFLRIPYGVHEQNGVLGRANRALAGGARFTAHGFPSLSRAPRRARLIEVGNPVRDAVMSLQNAPYPPAVDGSIRVLIFGGSQGARLFSAVVPAAIAALPGPLRARLRIVQQVREEDARMTASAYAEAGVVAELAPFFTDLPARIANAHLVIARAGASSVSELSVIGRPSILIPLAIAMDDHQTGNARVLSDAGAAQIIAERDCTSAALGETLAGILSDEARLAGMAQAARGRVRSGAAAALADLIEELAPHSKEAHAA